MWKNEENSSISLNFNSKNLHWMHNTLIYLYTILIQVHTIFNTKIIKIYFEQAKFKKKYIFSQLNVQLFKKKKQKNIPSPKRP